MSSPLVPFNAYLVGASDENIGGTPVFTGFSGRAPRLHHSQPSGTAARHHGRRGRGRTRLKLP